MKESATVTLIHTHPDELAILINKIFTEQFDF